MSLIRFIDPAFTLSISYEKIPERINYELFKNVSFFLLIFSIEELKFTFTGTKISGKRNHWRSNNRSHTFNKSSKRFGLFRLGTEFFAGVGIDFVVF